VKARLVLLAVLTLVGCMVSGEESDGPVEPGYGTICATLECWQRRRGEIEITIRNPNLPDTTALDAVRDSLLPLPDSTTAYLPRVPTPPFAEPQHE
jgi:hypothetical protein